MPRWWLRAFLPAVVTALPLDFLLTLDEEYKYKDAAFTSEDAALTSDSGDADLDCDLTVEAGWLPENGLRGDCPQVLENGTACQAACDDGYNLTGWVNCSRGGEISSSLACTPSACNTVGEFRNFSAGDCPEMLPSGASCSPACGANHSLVANMSCAYGNLTDFECEYLYLKCEPGHEQRGGTCEPCRSGSWKADTGPGPCERCPDGVEDEAPEGQASSAAACRCRRTNYASLNETSREVVACLPCPPNSLVREGLFATRLWDCTCKEGYLRVPTDDKKELERCRWPRPCNIGDFLERQYLIGTDRDPNKLQLGTCEDYVRRPRPNRSDDSEENDTEDLENDTDYGWMNSSQSCSLACKSGTSPQVHTDFFRAVSLTIRCSDGGFTDFPEADTWCSEASFQIPPLIFLATVTLAAMTAGFRMERRQILFERQVLEALEVRRPPSLTPAVQPASAAAAPAGSRGSKCKMA